MSTAILLARWWACSLLAARVCRVPAPKREALCISGVCCRVVPRACLHGASLLKRTIRLWNCPAQPAKTICITPGRAAQCCALAQQQRSEEHTSELQSLMPNSYDGFCLKKTKKNTN